MVEICVVVEDRKVEFLGSSRDQQVRNLAAPLATLGQKSLYLERSSEVGGGGFYGIECLERSQQCIPFINGSGRVTDLKITDPCSAKLSSNSQRFDHFANLRPAEPL